MLAILQRLIREFARWVVFFFYYYRGRSIEIEGMKLWVNVVKSKVVQTRDESVNPQMKVD